MQTKWKNKKQVSKIQKTRKQNKRGTKREKQRTYKKKNKNGLVHLLLFFWFIVFFVFCFCYVSFFLFFFAWRKNICNIKATKKNKSRKQNKSTWTRPFFHISLVLKLCFLIFHVFSCFLFFCFKLKLIRISNWGEHEFRWITTICTEWSDWS